MLTALHLCLMALAGLFSVSTASHVPFPGGLGSFEMPSAVLRRDIQAGSVNQDLCTLWVGTWPWTDCKTFVSDNRLTMDEFVDMNPSVDTDCYGWVGGREYCVPSSTAPATTSRR